MPQPDQQLERKYITHVELHDLFFVISQSIGFSEEDIEDYEDDIFAMIEIWRVQGFIDIYIRDEDKRFGRAKNMASVRNSAPYYLNLFHARVVKGDNDPLLVITLKVPTNYIQTVTKCMLPAFDSWQFMMTYLEKRDQKLNLMMPQ